jgi:cell division septal protein FtsQ
LQQGVVVNLEKPHNVYSFGRHELITERKTARKIKNRLILIFIFILAILSLLLFMRSPMFTIYEISIDGADKISLEDIRATIGIREGMNIWKISPPEIKRRILTIPRIADVKVERLLPDKLSIVVNEKYPILLVPYHGYYLELASDGIFIGIKDTYEGELPLVNGLLWGAMDVGTGIPDKPRSEIIDVFLEALDLNPALPLAEINVEELQNTIIYTREGLEVWLGNSENLPDKLQIFETIYYRLLSTEEDFLEGYLDLRVQEAPVFKPIIK